MALQRFKVEGFEAFQEKASELSKDGEKTLIVLFSGSKDSSGDSWCPDCVTAEPVIEAALAKQSSRGDLAFLYVGVGDRAFWKDPKCVFRTNESTRLRTVPTLLKWGTQERLEEGQCAKPDMVQMLLQDE